MPEKTLSQKLLIKEGRRVLLVHAPRGYEKKLQPLPEGVAMVRSNARGIDIIQVFVNSRQELEGQLGKLKTALNPSGLLWVSYLKGTSKVKTDINRDIIAEYARSIGMEAVSIISIDDDWSALRLKML